MINKEQNGKIVYSDGAEIEKTFLELVQNYNEEEIREKIKDDSRYLINNTFSPVRGNLLEWYPFRNGCTILEIGARMGSLTKTFCKKAAHVTAVEMNEVRADIIRARCKDISNLTVVTNDVTTWKTNEKFDYVIMVGVLEYAAIFTSSSTAHADLLKKAAALLKSDGVLLLAIENRFGLRYWLGCSEDHIGKPFVGIQGYQQPNTAKTFSKEELNRMLQEQGLTSRFYYTLPDYKFPTAIFTDEGLPSFHDIYNLAFAYGRNSCLTANERDLYRDVINNGVFPFFANSFLVEAAISLPQKHVIRVNGRSEVRKENRILTIINSEGQVIKVPQNAESKEHLRQCNENERRLLRRGVKCLSSIFDGERIVSRFFNGQMANLVFGKAICQGDRQSAFAMLEKLMLSLKKSSDYTNVSECNPALKELPGWETESDVLAHGYIDMTFYNSFWIEGELVFFDQEWDFPGLPLKFLLYYNIKVCYQRAESVPRIPMSTLCAYIDVSQEQAARYDLLEEKLWASCAGRIGDIYGEDGYYNRYGVETFETFSQKIECERQKAHESEKHYAEIQQEKEAIYEKFLAIKEREKQYIDLISALKQEKTNIIMQQQLQKSENKNELEAAKQESANLYGEVLQLRDKENRYLNEIAIMRASRSWRFGQFFSRIVRFFIPIGSRRAFFLRLLVTTVRHPRKFFACLTSQRVRKFFYLLRQGDLQSIRERIQINLTSPKLDTAPPEVVPVATLEEAKQKTVRDYPVLSVPHWENPQVSIVIPVYNQFDFTYHCVESIIKNSGDITYEILIGNDCSTDLTTQIEQIIPGVRCITTEKNLRFVLNCKNTAKYANGIYLLFLNNDTQVQPNWLKPLVDLIESADDIGMVGAKLVYPDGTLQEAGGILWRDGSAWNYGHGQNPALPEFNYVKEVDYISGAAIMLSRALWEEIGGFDERFVPAYCDDSDLAFTIRKMGYRVMYQPKSVVVHFEGVSNGTDIATGQKQYQVINSKKFYEKWKDILEAEHFDNGQHVFQARDRSMKKRTVLLIDHYVPMYDKDAGSRTIYQYIQLLVKMGCNVKFIGDNFYPHQPYTQQLEQMGVEILYGLSYQKNWKGWLHKNGQYLDVVFINRPHIAQHYIDAVKEYTEAKIIYNVCDLHFVREEREYRITGNAERLESSRKWKKIELEIMKKSDVVFTLSTDEQRILEEYLPKEKISICPIFIYSDFSRTDFSRRKTQDLLFVGGFSHTPNVDAMNWFCEEVMPRILEKMPDIRLNIVGSNPPESVKRYASEHINIKGFISDEELQQLYDQSRLCVIPLRYGAGVKGKTIEAMYSCIPIVSTSIGIEGLPEIDQVLCAHNTADEFAHAVLTMYDKDNTSSVRAAYNYVKDHYSEKSVIAYFQQQFFGKEEHS